MNDRKNNLGQLLILGGAIILAGAAGYGMRAYTSHQPAKTAVVDVNDTDLGKFSDEHNIRQSANAGQFDFYVLSLSWSPTFCALNGDRKGAGEQCNSGHSYGFIVHGLWPQFESGYPKSCPYEGAYPSHDLVEKMMDIMPSQYLITGEWKKHGTCSGLSPDQYFETLRNAFDKVKIPKFDSSGKLSAEQVEAEFINANPALKNDEIAVQRDGGYMSEVRICMTKQLEFRACKEVDENGANGGAGLKIPPPK